MRPGKLPGPPLKRAILGQLKEGINQKDKNIGVGCDAGFGIWRKNSGFRGQDTSEENRRSGENMGSGENMKPGKNQKPEESMEPRENMKPGESRRPGEDGDPGENTEIYALDTVLSGAAPVDLFFGFHRGANSVLAAGGIPRWVTVTLLLPESLQEPKLRELMSGIDALCASRKIEILGGQTETLPGLAEITVNFHFMGTKYREDFPLQTEPGKVRPGDAIVMSGFPAADLAGKWLVKERNLLEKRFCPAFLAQAEEKIFGRAVFLRLAESNVKARNSGSKFEGSNNRDRDGKSEFEKADERFRDSGSNYEETDVKIRDNILDFGNETVGADFPSVEKTACFAMDFGVRSMHDIGEGGVFGALRELGEREGCGLEVDLKKIPIQQEVIELCEVFDRNPYLTKSCGALLMVTPDPDGLVRGLAAAGVQAAEIGKITGDRKMTVYNKEEIRYLDHPQMDESWR